MEYFHFIGRSPQTQSSALEGFNQAAQALLAENEVADYVLLLMGLYGVRTLKDLCEFGPEDVDEIVKLVRSGSFGGIEFTSRAARLKYLGGEFPDLASFMFKPMDKKKLNRLSEAATDALGKEERANELRSQGSQGGDSAGDVASTSTRKR